jgi:hypothetical protein
MRKRFARLRPPDDNVKATHELAAAAMHDVTGDGIDADHDQRQADRREELRQRHSEPLGLNTLIASGCPIAEGDVRDRHYGVLQHTMNSPVSTGAPRSGTGSEMNSMLCREPIRLVTLDLRERRPTCAARRTVWAIRFGGGIACAA